MNQDLESFRTSLPGSADPFPILGFDHVEFHVGNATQGAHFYRSLGFVPVAFRGLETGSRDEVSWCLRQGEVTFVLTGGLGPESPVDDAAVRIAQCCVLNLTDVEHGHVIGRERLEGGERLRAVDLELAHVTHVEQTDGRRAVGKVELGRMDEWVSFYERVMGFAEMRHFSDEEISTEYSALMSKVLWDGVGKIKLPINEPATGRRRSQIDEYLMYHRSPGVQHIALRTDDIVATVAGMQAAGVGFLRVPDGYYDEVRDRVPEVAGELEALRTGGILVDADEDGHLLQIFTRPLQDRPTFFLEVIERHGSLGFGAGNFKALFESIEREQAMRGNL